MSEESAKSLTFCNNIFNEEYLEEYSRKFAAGNTDDIVELVLLDITFYQNGLPLFVTLVNDITPTHMTIDNCKLELEPINKTLANKIDTNYSIETLTLSNMSASAFDTHIFQNILPKFSSLRILHLRKTIFTSETSKLFLSLKLCTNLRELWVKKSNADNESLQSILCSAIESLRDNVCLEVLSFDSVHFSENSISSIFELSLANSSIKTINCWNCGIDDSNLYIIVNALANNTTLTTLDISNNNITEEAVGLIETIIKQNQTLRVLGLNGTHIVEGIVRLSKALIGSNIEKFYVGSSFKKLNVEQFKEFITNLRSTRVRIIGYNGLDIESYVKVSRVPDL